MKEWKEYLKKDPVSRLLESDSPSIRYFTLTELLGKHADDETVIREKNAISSSALVTKILGARNSDGYWGKTHESIRRFSGTLWQLMILLETGFDPSLPGMQKAAEYLLDVNFDGSQGMLVSWKKTPQVPCYQSQILWVAIKCGLSSDPRVKTVIGWIRDNVEFHDGDDTVKNPDDMCLGRHTCIRAAVPLVQALAAVPQELRDEKLNTLLRSGNEFLLIHHVYRRSHNTGKSISPYMTRLTFPGFYYPDMLQILYLLTGEGIFDTRMEDAIEAVRKKQDADGMWKLQRQYNERKPGDTFPVIAEFGEKGEANEWITLRALCVLKRWYENAGQHGNACY
jgi:hypothetical protein